MVYMYLSENRLYFSPRTALSVTVKCRPVMSSDMRNVTFNHGCRQTSQGERRIDKDQSWNMLAEDTWSRGGEGTKVLTGNQRGLQTVSPTCMDLD